jgi:ATP-dependent Lon protease
LSTKDTPEPARASHPLPSLPSAPLLEVPVLALDGLTLFPGTLVPLHAYEPEACRALAEALADRRLIVLAAIDRPGPDRPVHTIAGLGRIVSDRRSPDGRLDAFVHGLERVSLERLSIGTSGLVADLAVLPDERTAAEPTSRDALAGLRLVSIATAFGQALIAAERTEEAECLRSLVASSTDLALVSNRLAASFVVGFEDRQALLAEVRVAARIDRLAALIGSALLAVAAPDRRRLH